MHTPLSVRQRGYIVLVALVFLASFSAVSTALLSSLTSYARLERGEDRNAQALALAEAAIDKAAYELNQNPSYAGESNTALGSGTFSISIATIDSSTKEITATGYIPNSTSPTATRIVRAKMSIDSNVVSFRYGVQAGAGGFVLSGGSTINGSVYSNGSINATTGVHITGSAVAANPPALAADQVNNSPTPISSCTSANCITFATTTASQDLAQSFRISSATALNKVELYIKKVSTPSDATIRIVNDSGGVPGTTTFMTATLPASAVTTNFGWVSVSLPTTPILDPSETYWLVIDAASNSSRYYIIGANSNGYANGIAKIGRYGSTWSSTSPTGLDAYFSLYLGGGTSMIGGNTYTTGVYVGTGVSDSASAHTVMGATVSGPLYCQTSSYTNKACNTSQADPAPESMPISDGNISDWQAEAVAGGTTSGNYTVGYAGGTIGPRKITGNVLVNGGGTLTVSGTLWIEGSLTVTGGGKLKLASSYGTGSGVIVVDGVVVVDGGASFAGSGQTGSYPFVITTSACPAAAGCSGANAISVSGGAGTVVLAAQNGTASISGGGALKSITAKQIVMSGGATLTYDSGLANMNFSSGPGGSWQFVPGSYVITR